VIAGRDAAGLGVLALAVAAVPLVVTSPYHLSVGTFAGIHAVVTIGLCLLMGYAGQISLGQAAFYGLGAYASGLLTTRLGLDPWLAMVGAAALTGLVAYVFGGPILRLRGHYLAMATLAFGIIVYLAFVEFTELTGGPSGLPGIPRLAVGGFVFDTDRRFFYLTWGAVIVVILLSLNVVNSRVGRALRAIHGSEVAAETLGVNTTRYKLGIFALSAVYASLAGSLYAHYLTFVSPPTFGFIASVEFVVMAAVGGLASVWGAPFGALAVTLLAEGVRDVMPRLLAYASGEHEVIAYGLLLIVIMIFMPEGLTVGGLRLVRRLVRDGRS
jgi:branched-chain amino acid transport system permease protein